MAYIFGDGFDCYAATSDMDDGYWDVVGTGQLTFGPGRFSGSQCLLLSGVSATAALLQKAGANDAVHHISLAIQQTGAITGSTNYAWFTFMDGATAQCSVVFRSDGAIMLQSGASNGTTLATYAGALTANNTWYQFEIEIRVSNTAGYMNVRKLGNTSNDFATATNLDTAGTANDYANTLKIGSGTSGQQVDDLLWRSDSVANGVAWVGDIRCQTRRPASDASVQWTPSGSVVPVTPYTGAAGGGSNINVSVYTPFVAPCSGTISSGSLSFGSGAGITANVKVALFANAGNTPTSVLATANVIANPAANVAATVTFPSPATVTQGTQYWFGVITDTGAPGFWVRVNSGPTSTVALQGTTNSPSYAAFPIANPVIPLTSQNPMMFSVNITPTAALNAPMVADIQQDAANTYVYSSTVGQSDLYGISSIATTPASIVAVTTRAYLQKSDAGTRNTSVLLKSGSTTVGSTSTALNTTFGWQARTDVVDPATGLPWTAVGVANAQIGVSVTA